MTLTTAIRRSQPVDELKEISLGERVYFHAQWHGLTLGEHGVLCNLYDEQDRLLFTNGFRFIARTSNSLTWCYHTFRAFEKPGIWRYEIFLDDRRIAGDTVVVLARPPQAVSVQATVASALDDGNRPVDNLKEIALSSLCTRC